MNFMSSESRRPVFIALLVLALTAFGLSSAGCGDSSLTSSLDPKADGGDAGGNNSTDAGTDTTPQPDAGDPDTGDPDPCLQTTPEQAAEFAEDYVTSLCEKLLSCGQNPNVARMVTFGGWGNLELCKEAVRAGTISAGRAEEGAREGSLTLNSCKKDECLQRISNLDCLSAHAAVEEARFSGISACYDAWEGTRGAGADCTVDAQCKGDQVCSRDQSSVPCTGTCVDAGQSSTQCGDIVCAHDQYCKVDTEICVTRGGAGTDCEDDYQCSIDTRCDNGTCATITTGLGQGETCNNNDRLCSLDLGCINQQCSAFGTEGTSCQFYGCKGDLYCNVETEQCAPRLAAGEPCAVDEQCVSRTCADNTCTDVDALCPGD